MPSTGTSPANPDAAPLVVVANRLPVEYVGDAG